MEIPMTGFSFYERYKLPGRNEAPGQRKTFISYDLRAEHMRQKIKCVSF